MKNPIIGITFDFENSGGYSKFPWYAIRENYLTCLYKFGAIPFPILHENSLNNTLLKVLDGLVITGGNFDFMTDFVPWILLFMVNISLYRLINILN